ncbi:hypothetical protein ACIQMV_08980 [Streptomyces sp. NPDC091412]|uniref:hypothetical protein n=1 Tax=Streptomyces sp. NPDC091412 TaxID=3366002 RepID=UPI0037F786E3
MPIVHSDRISGTIYVIADSAGTAQRIALDYLHDKTDYKAEGEVRSYGVHDHQADADRELHNRYGSYDTDRDHVYAISLDIRIADEN